MTLEAEEYPAIQPSPLLPMGHDVCPSLTFPFRVMDESAGGIEGGGRLCELERSPCPLWPQSPLPSEALG